MIQHDTSSQTRLTSTNDITNLASCEIFFRYFDIPKNTMLHTFLMICIVFVAWGIAGSFGGVILTRGQTISRKNIKDICLWRSRCDTTGKTLARYQLIPFVGYFFSHHRPVSQYLIRELSCGILFITVGFSFDWTWSYDVIARYIFWRSTMMIVLRDIQTYTLHMMMFIVQIISLIPLMILTPPTGSTLAITITAWLALTALYIGAKYYVQRRYPSKTKTKTTETTETQTEWLWIWDVYSAPLCGYILSFLDIPLTGYHLTMTITIRLLLASIGWLLFVALRWSYMMTDKKHFWRQSRQILPFLPCLWWSVFCLWYYGIDILSLFATISL